MRSCSRWADFLGELLGAALDEDDVALLQQWCGLALLWRNLAQVMLILSGTAAGGKGTIVNVLNGVIGEANVHQLRTEHLGSRFETSFYVDKTLLYGADVEPNFLNTSTAHFLKSLTGDDLLTTEGTRVRGERVSLRTQRGPARFWRSRGRGLDFRAEWPPRRDRMDSARRGTEIRPQRSLTERRLGVQESRRVVFLARAVV
jgi:hypothetical protein